MEDAVLKVRQRLERASSALQAAGIPFAIVGGNAVAAWVATVDEGAVRNTRNLDVMVRRGDLDRMREVLESVGFVYRHVAQMDIFLDDENARASDAVHLVFANEFVRPDNMAPNPDLGEVVLLNGTPVIGLLPLVEIKLTAWRDKDRTHLRDMLQVGLIDESWLDRLPASLAGRLKQLIDDPNG
ncbi:hypothetical protein [Fimbriimonas ginsengisoli]|nr:hypothetical protein [Fimbriimonas ginsengisoli]